MSWCTAHVRFSSKADALCHSTGIYWSVFLLGPRLRLHRFQTLGLFVEIVNFLVKARHLGFWFFSAPKLFERFANREFRSVSHSNLTRDFHSLDCFKTVSEISEISDAPRSPAS